MERLYVHYQKRLVGQITLSSSLRMQFAYVGSWLAFGSCFPISVSLPLNGDFTESASHHYFSNLLPEGNVREQICKTLKISPNNDFELLKAIGGDCAGALTISESDIEADSEQSDDLPPQIKRVTAAQLSAWSLASPNNFASVTGRKDVRLSLAGAQDKLPIFLDRERICLPLGNTPSTHILKFASPYYSHLPENETFITLLAQNVGLPVVEVEIRKTSQSAITLVKRYDRLRESGQWIRLHQEDFCQALGIDASQKYQKEGGPSLVQCADVIRKHSAFPLLDLQKLLRWSLFNLLVGNDDGHGKNLSLLYQSDGTVSLAPFYDLVCTRNYQNLAREMAMSLGGQSDPDLVSVKNLEGLAADFAIRTKLVTEETQELAEKIITVLPEVIANFRDLYGESPVLDRLPIVIRKIVRRVNTQMKRSS